MHFASETWWQRQWRRAIPTALHCWFLLSTTSFHFLFENVNVICRSTHSCLRLAECVRLQHLFIYTSFVFLYTVTGVLSHFETQCHIPLHGYTSVFLFALFFLLDLVYYNVTQTFTHSDWSIHIFVVTGSVVECLSDSCKPAVRSWLLPRGLFSLNVIFQIFTVCVALKGISGFLLQKELLHCWTLWRALVFCTVGSVSQSINGLL